ncbi:MAG: hypothetical protein KKB74_02990 [Bacteroidetes bacterium]|nr:hypothetical protein [Bacteroidota bacterium]
MYNFSSTIDDGKCVPATAGIAELNHVWNSFYELQKSLTNEGNPLTTQLVRYYYWLSSENSNDIGSWSFDFYQGHPRSGPKMNEFYVRSIRAF